MGSTVNSVGHGGYAVPPFALKDLSGLAAKASLRPFDAEFSRRSGARNKLRVANFVTFSGSPGIFSWPRTRNKALGNKTITGLGSAMAESISP